MKIMEVFMKIRKISMYFLVMLCALMLFSVMSYGRDGVRVSKKQLSVEPSKHPICNMMKGEKWKMLSGSAHFARSLICGNRVALESKLRKPIPGNPAIIPGLIVNDPQMDDIADQTTQSQPTIVKDPTHGTMVIMYNDSGDFDYGETSSIYGYSISTDNGATWTDMGPVPAPQGNWNLGGGGLAYHEASGKIYFVSMLCSSVSCAYEKLLVGQSTDGGFTWSQLSNIAPLGEWDKPFIWVDNTGGACDGYVYVVATDFISAPAIKFIRSTDGGQTWDNPVVINAGHENCDTGAFPRVASDGTIYVAWEDFGCIQPGDMTGIEMVKSTDCGATWSNINVVSTITQIQDPEATFECGIPALKGKIRVNDYPFLGINPADSSQLYVVFNSDPDGDINVGDHSDVFFTKSTDGGSTWSAPLRLNDDTTLNDNFMPFLEVAPNGLIGVGWYDRREDSNNLYMRIWVTASPDGGTNWVNNFPVGSVIFPPAVNFDPIASNCYMGDYNYSIADASDFHLAWGDNRRIESNPPHTGPRNDPDVYYDNIPLDGPGGILIYSSHAFEGGDEDAYAEPGEILDLDVYIKNVGSSVVSNIAGVLKTSTPGVSILKANSTYPDVDVDEVVVNNTHFQFKIDPNFICGDKIDFVLTLTTSEGDFNIIFSLVTGEQGPLEVLFSDDFESGIGEWQAYDMCSGNLMWHLTTACESSSTGHSIPTSAYYGNDGTCNYDTGEWECGAIESPTIDLSDYRGAVLDFNYFLSTEQVCPYDSAYAEVSPDGGLSWTPVAGNCDIGNLMDPSSGWQTISGLELPGTNFASSVKIRFRFDTQDPLYNAYEGFYVDDVVVSGYKSACEISPFAVQPYVKPHVNDGGNGIIEPDEAVSLQGHLVNIGVSTALNVAGTLSSNDPINIPDTMASYGDIAAGENKMCTDCYDNVVAPLANRPGTHWDFTVSESVSADGYGPRVYDYVFHVGGSFSDVLPANIFYPYVETILHSGVTSGCTPTQYCPNNNVLRNQMAKFICTAMEKADPGSCSATNCAEIFSDVPASNPFCPFIEALYNANIVTGCGTDPLRYCPTNPTSRQAMAKFICLGMDAANQGTCTVNPCAGIFGDVPSNNPFCSYIETLYNAGIISGCSTNPMLYCPTDNVKRGQMAKFIINAFNFTL